MCLDLWELSALLRRIKVWTHCARISAPSSPHFEGFDPCARTAYAGCFVLRFSPPPRLAAAPASAQQPYDGLWQVTVVTKTGSCDAQTTSTVTVSDGKVSPRARRFPAASAAGDLCESRSMVHMRTVNSVATPDRGNGMGHQLAYRAAVDGKRPVSKPAGTRSEIFAHTRRLTFAAAAFFMASLARRRPRAVRRPFAGMAGNWAGGGTVTLDDGSNERIRCRATYPRQPAPT